MEWDDIRFFHAVAEAGSLSGAARRLNVSQPTVGRRVKMLEDRLQAQLFHRLASGYELTESGQRIFDKATEMAVAARCIADRVSGTRLRAEGRISLTTAEGLGEAWVVPRLSALSTKHPGLEVDLALSNERLDIAAGAADMALRMGDPYDDTLVGRRIGAVTFRLFASAGYLDRYGWPQTPTDLARHRIIECGGAIRDVPQALELRRLTRGAQVAITLDSIFAQTAAAQAGFGLVALADYMVEGKDDLVCVLPDAFHVAVPVWVLTRGELHKSMRVAAVKTFLAGAARDEPAAWGHPIAAPVARAMGA